MRGLAQPLEGLEAAQAPGQIRTAMRVSELVTMRPPTMLTMRSAWSITRWSWVTRSTVVRPGTVRHAPEQFQDGLAGLGVERGGWLVGEHQGRVVHQRTRDGDPLFLAARRAPPAGG